MIDTLIITIRRSQYVSLKQYANDVKTVISNLLSQGGEYKQLGKFHKVSQGDIQVFIYDKHFRLKLSLWKFFKGNNIVPFDLAEIRQAIKQLSLTLGICVEKGFLSRIDIALNIETEYPVANYIRNIIKPNRYECFDEHIDESVSFRSKSNIHQISFYDKIKQARSKNIPIKDDYPKNLLRFEYRITNQLHQTINLDRMQGESKVRVIHLYSSSFLRNLFNRWFRHFWKINWIASPIHENITGMKELRDFLCADAIMNNGGIEAWSKMADGFVKKNGQSWKPPSKSKARAFMREVTSNKNLIRSSKYTQEIKSKMVKAFKLILKHQNSAIF
jgi:hypothetical protein